MKRFVVVLLLACLVQAVQGQSFREQFTEANLLTEDGYLGLAIPFWEALLKERNNANINYKLGRCYLDLELERQRALPFLKRAAKDVRRIYDPYSSDFEGAPVETYYYLGKAYHINTKLDSAEKYYQLFLDDASKKHYLRPSAEKALEMCTNAREFMANPVDVEILNIGAPINSPYAEYSPIVAFDENTLYYTSRRLREDASNEDEVDMQTGHYYEDMYVSFRNLQGNWMNPELLSINLPNAHSSVVSMSPDGKTIYIYKTYTGDGNIYESTFEVGTGWTEPTLVGSDVNTKHNEYFAAITSDNQRLYFVSDRPGGKGGKDIWYCNRLPNGEWGKAINMGAPINTEFDEDSPYIHPNSKTLYFASNGHKSMGGYDIFTSKRVGDDWTTPENMGYPINTTDDDHSYVGTPSGERAYYSSKGSNSLGSTDIYVIEYPDESPTKEGIDLSDFALLKGWVLTPSGSLPETLKIYVTDTQSDSLMGEATPVMRNGSFVFILPTDRNYRVDYSLDKEVLITEHISIPYGQKYQELSREIILSPSKLGKMEAIAIDAGVFEEGPKFKLFQENGSILPIGSKVFYLDTNDKPIDSVYVSKDGFFVFEALERHDLLRLKPAAPGIKLENLGIELQDEEDRSKPLALLEQRGVFVPEESKNTPPKPRNQPSKPGKSDGAESSDQAAHPAQEGAELFSQRFGYNQFEVDASSIEFKAALEAIKNELANGVKVKLTIVGSASKVPTATYGRNQVLAEKRAKNFENQLLESLKAAGIDTNKISTIDVLAIVSGPDYTKERRGKTSLFSDFQYVRLVLN